jgi:hypothetical protein
VYGQRGDDEDCKGNAMTEMTREGLRDEIEQVYQTSLMRRYWGFVGRGLARLVGGKGEAPMWVSVMMMMLLIQIITAATAFILKDRSATSVSFIYNYPMLFYIWFCVIVLHGQVERFIGYFKNDFVSALNLSPSQSGMEAWLRNVGRRSTQVLTTLFVIEFMTSVTIYVLYSQRSQPAGISVYLFTVLVFANIASHLYWILIFSITFAFSTRKLSLNLFSDDPSKTPVIQEMHQVSSNLLLMVALLLAVNILIIIPLNLYSRIYLIAVVTAFWVPLLLYFLFSESAFSRLLIETKLKRLEILQHQIMDIENNQDMSQKEPAEAVQRLLDLHDRAKSAPVSLINLSSIANLLGSLALPLLAALISIFDIWQKIFGTP